MTKEMYLSKRQELLDEAQAAVDTGEVEKFDVKKQEIEALDVQYDNEARAAADFTALTKSAAVSDLSLVSRPTDGTVAEKTSREDHGGITAASTEYLTAWAKKMQGVHLTEEDAKTLEIVNAAEFTHTTENTGIVIPETVAAGIWTLAEGMYPIYRDVTKTSIKGLIKIIKGDALDDAKWYDEGTPTQDAKETFAEVTLSGCELARRVKVSWMLKSMAIAEFIPYITRKIAEMFGKALGYGVSHGKGKPSSSESFKPEPLGIITALDKETGAPQIAAYAQGALTYKNITDTIARIRSQYSPKLYANSTTVWGELANVMDGNKRPLFVADPVTGGVGRILGLTVEKDDSLSDGEILMGDLKAGYHLNINETMSIRTFENDDQRETRYMGYAIVDGTVIDNKAFALLRHTAAPASK